MKATVLELGGLWRLWEFSVSSPVAAPLTLSQLPTGLGRNCPASKGQIYISGSYFLGDLIVN